MQLHAATMALVDGKLQRIVAWTLTGTSRQTAIPWLNVGRVDSRCTNARLQQYGIDVDGLQPVQYVAELPLLLFDAHAVMRIGRRPVDASDGCQPDGTYLRFGLWASQKRQEKKYKKC